MAGSPKRRFRSFLARVVHTLGILLGFLLLGAATGLFTITQTRLGRDAVASYIERKLEGSFHADVTVGPILAGNLLTRVVLERFAIAEVGGEVFVELDSVRLSYDPLAFLANRFTFRQVDAARGRLELLQGEDGKWNFDRIFRGTGGPSATQVVLTDFHVGFGHVELRKPWASDLTGAAYDSAGAAGVRGDALWRVESTSDGRYEQVVEADNLRGSFPLLRLAHPRLPVAIRLQGVAAQLKAVQLPLDVTRFDGELVFRDSVEVEIGRAELPASSLSGAGWIGGSPTQYRFDLKADPAGFSDFQWLPIPMPKVGGGPMNISLYTRGDVALVEVRDGDVAVRDSRMDGSFTLALEETPRLERLSVRLHPLRLALMDTLLARPSLLDGYLTASLKGSGPITGLQVQGQGTLQDVDGSVASSGVEAEGRVSIFAPHEMRDLRLQFEDFEPRWAQVVGVGTNVPGRLTGFLELDGDTEGGIRFGADLFHSLAESPESHLMGSGSIDLEQGSAVDVQMQVDPLSLALLAPYFPDLKLVGTVRGPISARGTLERLQANADLETPRGHLTFDGRFDLKADRKRYDAQVTARGIDLRQWERGWPETQLAVAGRVTGEGTDPSSLDARFDLEILPSLVHEARVDTSLLRFQVAHGLARVDTFVVRTDVANLRGHGGFGLSGERSGTLILDVDAPDLSRWNRWLVPGRSGAGAPEEPEDLFAGFPDARRQAAAGAPLETLPDTLRGILKARGALFGNVGAFSFGGRLTARGAGYGSYGADSLAARLDVKDPKSLDSLVLNLTAWNARAWDVSSDSLFLRLVRAGSGPSAVRIFATRDSTFALDAEADVGWNEQRRSARFDRLRLKLGGHTLALSQPATLALGDSSGLVAQDLVVSGDHGEFLSAQGVVPAEGNADFRLRFRELHMAEILAPYPAAPDFAGTLSGELSIQGTARAPRMEGSLRVEQPGIGHVSYPLLEGSARYTGGRIVGELALGDGVREMLRAEGDVRADLAFVEAGRRFSGNAFDFRVRADSMPLKPVELLATSLEDVRGYVRGAVRVTGGPGNLRLNGDARVERGEAGIPDLEIRLVKARGRVRFQGSEARLDSVGFSSSGGGKGSLTGTVGLSRIRDPSFDLHVSARELQAVNRRSMSFLASGEATLQGSYREPVITGNVRAFNGDIREEEFLRTQTIIDLTDPNIFALIDTTIVGEQRLLEAVQNPFMRNLRLDMNLAIGPNLWLRSDVLNVALESESVNVRMDRARESIVAFGTVRLVRGRYVFDRFPPYRQPLRITGGSIDFVGEPGLNPNLQITAEYRTRTEQGEVLIRVKVGGTMRQTELTLESEPPLADSDQLCFLALGAPCVAAADVRQADRLVREGVLGTIGSGLSSALVGDVGLDYLTLRSTRQVGEQRQKQGFFSQGVLAGFAGTELEVGKYVRRDLFVTVAQPLGGRYPGWSVEWRFTPHWTVEARAENRFGRRFGLATGSSLEFDQTFGLFIFRQWSF